MSLSLHLFTSLPSHEHFQGAQEEGWRSCSCSECRVYIDFMELLLSWEQLVGLGLRYVCYGFMAFMVHLLRNSGIIYGFTMLFLVTLMLHGMYNYFSVSFDTYREYCNAKYAQPLALISSGSMCGVLGRVSVRTLTLYWGKRESDRDSLPLKRGHVEILFIYLFICAYGTYAKSMTSYYE